MRTYFAMLLAASAAVALATSAGHTQEAELKDNVKVFMRAKLSHSQEVLEGLTTEDFDKIAKGSQEMSLLSLAAQWQIIQTPEYTRRSAEFRREVEALKTAAENKNLDGATLAYLKVTMNCIECHKYVRGVREARLEELLPQNRIAFTSHEVPR